MSGGQKQLLNLASIMVMRPEVLLLDEPTAQLDPLAKKKFIDTVLELNRDFGITIMCVEHNLADIYSKVDRVLVLEDGKLYIIILRKKRQNVLLRQRIRLCTGCLHL